MPGFIRGEVYDEPLAVAQYCAALFLKPTTAVKPDGTPLTVPLTVPRPEAATKPEIPRVPKKEMSRLALGALPDVKTRA